MATRKPLPASEYMKHIRTRYELAMERLEGPWCNYGRVTFSPDETDEFYNIAPYGSVWDQEKGIFCSDDRVADMVAMAPKDLEYMINLVEMSTVLVDEVTRRLNIIYEFVEHQIDEDVSEYHHNSPGHLEKIFRFVSNMLDEGHGGGLEEPVE